MMKKFLLCATAIVAPMLAQVPSSASAAIVTFEDKTAFSCNGSGTDSSGGLSYSYGFFACYYSPAAPADFPTTPPSTVMASGYSPTTFSLAGGGAFSLQSLDLAFGPFGHDGVTSDTTTVTGNLVGGGTLSTVLTVGRNFGSNVLNWNGLSSVTFSALNTSSEYLAFDNIAYSASVPEPATWALMIAGFGIMGATMRRRQPARIVYD